VVPNRAKTVIRKCLIDSIPFAWVVPYKACIKTCFLRNRELMRAIRAGTRAGFA